MAEGRRGAEFGLAPGLAPGLEVGIERVLLGHTRTDVVYDCR